MIPKNDSLFYKMLANTFVLVRVPQKNRTYKRIYIFIYIYNWFMQLWRLRNPKICSLSAGDPGKLTKF